MGLLKTLGSALGLVEKSAGASAPAAGLLPTLGATPSVAGVNISQATAITVSAVYRAMTVRAQDVARCRPRLIYRDPKDGPQEVTDHPVARLFRRPNRVQTWNRFALQMEAALVLRGNAFAAILRDGAGAPVELIPVNPDAVMVLEAQDGQIFYMTNRVGLFQMAALGSMPVAIPAEDMLHLSGISFNATVGLSPIHTARDAIGLAMGLEQQASRLAGNGARPGGVLQSAKQLTEAAAKRLREQWQALQGGIQNTGATAILEDGLEWKPITMTSVDAQFIEQRNMSVIDVSRFFGVPLHKLNVDTKAGQARMDQEEQRYVNGTVMPDLELWEQEIERAFDLDREGLEVELDERVLLRAEEATRINNGRLAVMSGLMTQNEWRRREGLPPVNGGDVLLTPVNLAAVGSDLTGTAPDGAGRPAGDNLPDPGAANAEKKD